MTLPYLGVSPLSAPHIMQHNQTLSRATNFHLSDYLINAYCYISETAFSHYSTQHSGAACISVTG